MRQATAVRAFDINDVEKDLKDVIGSEVVPHRTSTAEVTAYAPPSQRLPEYVSHVEGVNELGKLSAEAIVNQFEDAAKEIEAMAKELTESAKRCEEMVAGAHAAAEKCMEVATLYRDQGKRYFTEIENCSVMTDEVRKACDAMMTRIASPAIAPPVKS
jgi:hypothetical protein